MCPPHPGIECCCVDQPESTFVSILSVAAVYTLIFLPGEPQSTLSNPQIYMQSIMLSCGPAVTIFS